MLTLLARLLAALNSEAAPGQIAGAVCLALVVGLSPAASPHNLLILLLVVILRVHLASFLVATAAFSAVAWIFDPILHGIGAALLQAGPLAGLWTAFYNLPGIPLTRFNNTLVMGGLVTSLAVSPLLYPATVALVRRYRETFLVRLRGLWIVKWLNRTPVAAAYRAVTGG